jgi:Right handed beta helix region
MIALFMLVLAALTTTPASTYYVAPTGTPGGNGSRARPWDLATALAGAAGRVHPGDTVWLRGGRYRGSFHTQLQGAPGRPIVFRQERGARATIDGTLFAQGSDLVFWGFEIMQSNPAVGTYGLQAQTNNGRFINLVIHDAGSMGVSFWTPGENAELYGCVIYNNGTHENLDHGVYVHNERGLKRIVDNVFFDNLAYGIHAYAGPRNPPQRGIAIQGNITFNNGTISQRYRAKGNILVGGDVPMSGVDVSTNFLFYSGTEGVNLRLGYAPVANSDLTARGNYIWGGETGIRLGQWAGAQLDGNTVGGSRTLLADAAMPLTRANLLLDEPGPAAPAVFVRPNQYEHGRAFIVVYNFPRRAGVKADVSAVLNPGESYELRSVQDLFGPPIAHGAYTGDSIAVPMASAVLPPKPLGRATAIPPVTRPLFDVLLLTVSAGGAAAPTGTR